MQINIHHELAGYHNIFEEIGRHRLITDWLRDKAIAADGLVDDEPEFY